ncbi:EamA family transporter RarD [Marinobacterium arenosum]|uniref:EamA family transporter RarD n=1 Tax=Marinobacterium arenosum TaxID=2862496 RepID=UPI001C98D829|nr:EamA family transporter RarD [Marinobacterium arenosum]MBY4675476.1 EamA family transporter RarD [Marinobacterium arenosum]
MNHGILSALAAFTLWGFLPLYWKALDAVPADQILTHRMVWSMLLLSLLLLCLRRWRWLGTALRSPGTLLNSLGCALLLALNWLTYIWSVNNGYIVEASLGYYINPLVSVLLGVLFLQERLRPIQWLSIALASCGVLYLTLSYGQLPWIALTLALTFGFYGLLRKKASLPSLEGQALETAMLFLPALGYILWLGSRGDGSFGQFELQQDLLLIGTGAATAVPLILFAYGAQRISLATLGILQYLAPSIQLLIGIWVYAEPFEGERAMAFMMIWSALAIYTCESLYSLRRRKRVSEAEIG